MSQQIHETHQDLYFLIYFIFFSKGLVKSRRKNGQDSQSRDTDADEKIAATKLLNVQLKIKI